jgi:chromosome segregation protein
MKLKKLVLQGYKTFASKTEFVFDGGITSIVGPNGSGKSNVSDAVRWVLGEQSYSSLRGKRTIDMIFAGSQSRPRAGMAQAILTLDNSDGWLPIDYTEVEIGRRAFRSGENEYILNGQKVRLKDVTDLLATSGLAQRTYTIIGQGLIDQALSLRAEERRALFEEAAGINHYKSRRAETLRRLQETQRNLQRVHDILAEVRPRLASLKRQATRAQNYEQVSADLHHLLRLWYGYKWERAKLKLRQTRDTAVSAETTWKNSRNKLRVIQENMNDLRRRINQLQQRVTETQEQRDTIRDQLEAAQRETAILAERRHAITRQLSELTGEFAPLANQQQQAQAELNDALTQLAGAQNILADNQTQLRQFTADFQTKQAEINRWQQSLQQAEQQRQLAQTRLAQAEGQLSQLQERLKEQNETDDVAFQVEAVQAEAEVTRLTAVLSIAEGKVTAHHNQRTTVQDERSALIRQFKLLRQEAREAEQQLNKQQNQLARMETRVEMLDQLRRIEIPLSSHAGLLGNLASFITVPAAYQTAVSAALQSRMTTLIFKDDAALWAAVAMTESPITAVALTHITTAPIPPTPKDTDVIGWAVDLIQVEGQAKTAVQLLLNTTLLVNDEQTAYKIAQTLPAGCLVVSRLGLIAHAGGLVETNARSDENSALAQEKAWREAQEALSQHRESLTENKRIVTLQQSLLQEKQDEMDTLQQDERRLVRLEQEAGQLLARAQRDVDRAKQQQQFTARQQETQAKTAARLQARVVEVQQVIKAQSGKVNAAETAVLNAETQLAALPIAEAQQQRDALQQAIQSAQTIVAGRQAVVDSRRATLNQVDRQLERLKDRQGSLLQQQSDIDQSDSEDRRVALLDELEKLDAQLGPLKERLTNHRKEMGEAEEEAAVFQKETHDAETIYSQTKINHTQQKNGIDTLQERIKSDLGIVVLSYDEDQTGPTPLPISGIEALPRVDELPEDIEDTIQNFRGQMQRMGAINPDAPAEYEETQTRYDFMTQQIEDLNQTEEQLRAIIAELDELTSKAFSETVDKVNDVFGKTFTQLFGGGAGRLVLTDPDDLTISGVDIVARLPNRREQGLGLLSGGERSLTAAALIFSLLKVSPTPFCIMDEVDAALDEANINRFRDLLHELSLKTQFIVITHNRGTIQVAQTIYGISMGSDSVSQAISIKPEDYVKQPELV